MSEDLISRKAVIAKVCATQINRTEEELMNMTESYWQGVNDKQITVMEAIRNMPIAYDVDKVVEQIESFPTLEVTQYPLHGKYLKKDSVLRILKGGGVDEQIL